MTSSTTGKGFVQFLDDSVFARVDHGEDDGSSVWDEFLAQLEMADFSVFRDHRLTRTGYANNGRFFIHCRVVGGFTLLTTKITTSGSITRTGVSPSVIALLLTVSFTGPIQAWQRPEPVIEFGSLLNSLNVSRAGQLELEKSGEALTTVFLPQGAAVQAVITKAGSATPLHVQDFYVVHTTEVFARLEARGKYKPFKLREVGDYQVTFRSGDTLMARMPFTVTMEKNDDLFDPRTALYLSGPWNEWAYAYSRLKDGMDGVLEFRMWGQRVSFDGATVTDKYDVELKKDGDVVAVTRTGHVGAQSWQRLRFPMREPESKGGSNYTIKQLVARDGTYHFVVRKNGNLHAVYALEVKNSKPVLHPRQASDHQPRTEYIVPRYAALEAGPSEAGNTVWMSRLSEASGKSIAEGTAAKVSRASDEQLRRWNWLPTGIDPNRDFQLVITDVQTRSDTHLAAGEDLIVFGTGFPNGVKYLKAGESRAREIPGGELYSSRLFHACGKKIVLVRDTQVVVFDTESQETVAIPETEISLYNPVGGLHGGNLLMADGYLVASVNRATEVTDGNIIKVIDVSGSRPVIIPIKNADYNDRQVSSVAVDAANGLVAVSSAEKDLVAVARVAPLASQNVVDVSEYRGVDRRQVFLEGTSLVYADEDLKVRLLKAGARTPIAITEEGVGRSSNGFVVRKGRLVVATREHTGTRYHMAVSDLPRRPVTLEGTGTTIAGTSGALGLGGCAAIAIDKTVFLAGTPSGGVGVGEHLQVLDEENGRWIPLQSDGRVVPAVDATTSIGLLAFKSTDADRNTTIGYATYGQRIDVSRLSGAAKLADTSDANGAKEGMTRRPVTQASTLKLADDNPFATADELRAAKLKAYLDNEKQVGPAFIQAFGKEQGLQRTVDGITQAMKAAGHESLIDDYLRLSAYVADEDRPKSTPRAEAPVDPKAVMSALNGEWKAIRLSAKGADVPDEAIESVRIAFAKGDYVMTLPGRRQTGTYTLDTSTSPMTMTISIGSGDKSGQERHGAFKLLKDDRLLIVFATNETDHPTRFVPDESGATFLAAYERVK